MLQKSSEQALARETRRFRTWAAAHPTESRRGEWETEYEHWAPLYDAFLQYLQTHPVEIWKQVDVDRLLYTLARDNEEGILREKVAEHPQQLIALARASLTCSESAAKWQLANKLGHLNTHISEAEAVLSELIHDGEEYVRRHALMALGRLHSPLVEVFVEQAWNTGDEYQRMAVLQALCDKGSSLLADYLTRADEDGRRYLTGFVARMRTQVYKG